MSLYAPMASIGPIGTVINTTPDRNPFAEYSAELATTYGNEAAAIVTETARDFGLKLEAALDLCLAGSPEFRAACVRSFRERQQRAAEARDRGTRDQARRDHNHQRESLEQRVRGAAFMLDAKQGALKDYQAAARANGAVIPDDSLNALSAEIDLLVARHAAAVAKLKAWDAAPDDMKTVVFAAS